MMIRVRNARMEERPNLLGDKLTAALRLLLEHDNVTSILINWQNGAQGGHYVYDLVDACECCGHVL